MTTPALSRECWMDRIDKKLSNLSFDTSAIWVAARIRLYGEVVKDAYLDSAPTAEHRAQVQTLLGYSL